MSEALDKQIRIVLNKKLNKEEPVPAIDRVFKEDRDFIVFKSLPNCIYNVTADNNALIEEYIERLELIESDLKWLLTLPYQKFWCQLIFDPSCSRLIDSYLRYAPRPYDILDAKLPEKVARLLAQIHRSVFLICLRSSTHKESKENFISQDVFSKLIYENFLFDIPKILDLCALYQSNPVLSKLVDNLFTLQPNYYNDFKQCIGDMIKAIESSARKLRDLFGLDEFSNQSKLESRLGQIFEVVYYLKDFFLTLNSALVLHPKLASILFEQKFDKCIRNLAEMTLFEIKQKMKDSLEASANRTLKLALKCLIYQSTRTLNIIITEHCVNPALSSSNMELNQRQQQAADDFLKLCCDLIEEKRLVCYYERHFDLKDQVELMFQLCANRIEDSQYSFLLESLNNTILMYSNNQSLRQKFTQGPLINESSKKTELREDNYPKEERINPSESIEPVKYILDLFPHLQKDYVEKSLKYFNNNTEQLINALLENNLPQFETETKETETQQNEFLTTRQNIFDNDEFDIFRKDKIDLSKINIGKKNTSDELDLDDRSDLKRFYQDNMNFNYEIEYEDEYDDTYDSNTKVASDNYDLDIKPLNQKLTVKKRDMFFSDDEEEEDDEGNEASEKKDQGSSQAQASKSGPYSKQQPVQQGQNTRQTNQGGKWDGDRRRDNNNRMPMENKGRPGGGNNNKDENRQTDRRQGGQQQRYGDQRYEGEQNQRQGEYRQGGQQQQQRRNDPRYEGEQNQGDRRKDENRQVGQQPQQQRRADPRYQGDQNQRQGEYRQGGQQQQRRNDPRYDEKSQGDRRQDEYRQGGQQPQQQRRRPDQGEQNQARQDDRRRNVDRRYNEPQGNNQAEETAVAPRNEDQIRQEERKRNIDQQNQIRQDERKRNADRRNNEAQGGGNQAEAVGNEEPNNQAKAEGENKSEAEIKRDRKWKNENKAKVAHHNRKDLAMKKNNLF